MLPDPPEQQDVLHSEYALHNVQVRSILCEPLLKFWLGNALNKWKTQLEIPAPWFIFDQGLVSVIVSCIAILESNLSMMKQSVKYNNYLDSSESFTKCW